MSEVQSMAKKRRTEAETTSKDTWPTARTLGPMLHAAKKSLSPRRLRLFAVACCKSLMGQSDAWTGYLELLQLAELMADAGSGKQMGELLSQAARFRPIAYPHGVIQLLSENALRSAEAWEHMVGLSARESKCLADVLREIVCNPFAKIQLDPDLLTWRDGTIPKLAQMCYESNDFSTIGILGDALEEAGCEPAILEHVRSKHPHFRGCWVVDLLLEKK
jgi:hypothetical protein